VSSSYDQQIKLVSGVYKVKVVIEKLIMSCTWLRFDGYKLISCLGEPNLISRYHPK
jgi:hypothetical protein